MIISTNCGLSATSKKLAGRGLAPALFAPQGGKIMEHELKSSQGFVVRAEKECDVYCPICRKILHVQEGQVIPRCCGKPMQVMD